jgi:aspartyl-tRNA synthetase
MYRTHTCGELRLADVSKKVQLAGWVQRVRKLGGMTFIDLRDRYGVTQLTVNEKTPEHIRLAAEKLGREFVLQVEGVVVERSSKNGKIPTGEVELSLSALRVLSAAEAPPFTIEDESDGGEELRAKYRYLDLRRNPVKNALMLRHRVAQEARKYLDAQGFLEIETPFLIKSTPEGARDFVVPSRLHHGEFYALPQSPQTFKQLLMVAGYDRYFQLVRCFRDEDLRADRQPEFTQIDCEMAFVEREDILQTFGGMMQHLFRRVLGVELDSIPRMTYADAMRDYGCDKPDVRFGMKIRELTQQVQGKGFAAFDGAAYVGGICAEGCAACTRKQLDELADWVKRPQIGAKGLVHIRLTEDGIRSSVDKHYTSEELRQVAAALGARQGDLILVLAGGKKQTLNALCELRLEMGARLGLRRRGEFAPLWIVDFPLLDWDDAAQRFYAMHHPFTSPQPDDLPLLMSGDREALKSVRADAYDFVMNGVELGGGSIRIFDAAIQQQMFKVLGFTPEDAEYKFGFLTNAFRFGAPPHGGIAFGFDRLCSMFGGSDSIRDYIAFPKNNAARDAMIDSPSRIDDAQLKELALRLQEK